LGAAEEEAASAATFEAMLLPWAAEEAPRVVALPRRIDYLNVISEALGGGGALGVHARCEGQADLGVASRPTASVHTSEPCHCCEQVTRQPILYFLVGPRLAGRRNELASRVAGLEVCGDALLADARVVRAEAARRGAGGGVGGGVGGRAQLYLRCGGAALYESFLAQHGAGLLGFVVGCTGAPLLGQWALPRLEAWPSERPPQTVLQEYLERRGCWCRVLSERA